MSYVPISTAGSSQRARELSRRITEAVDQFKRENPDMKGFEIRQALRIALRETSPVPRGVRIGLAALALAVGAVMFFMVASPADSATRIMIPAALITMIVVAALLLFVRGNRV